MRKRKTKYTREVLAPLVATSTSYSEVIRKLRLIANGGHHRQISARIRQWGLDTSHFGGRNRVGVEAIPESVLRADVTAVRSFAALLRRHELPTEGRAHRELKQRIASLGIDTSHFTGPAWNRGATTSTNESLARGVVKRRVSDDELFVANSAYTKGGGIIKRVRALRHW